MIVPLLTAPWPPAKAEEPIKTVRHCHREDSHSTEWPAHGLTSLRWVVGDSCKNHDKTQKLNLWNVLNSTTCHVLHFPLANSTKFSRAWKEESVMAASECRSPLERVLNHGWLGTACEYCWEKRGEELTLPRTLKKQFKKRKVSSGCREQRQTSGFYPLPRVQPVGQWQNLTSFSLRSHWVSEHSEVGKYFQMYVS